MSPTVAELVVGLIAAALVFMLAVRVIPLLTQWLAGFINRSIDEPVERNKDHHER